MRKANYSARSMLSKDKRIVVEMYFSFSIGPVDR